MTIIWSFSTFVIVFFAINLYSSTSEAEVIHSALRSNSIANSSRSHSNKSGTNGGIYFSDTPLSDAEGSADGPDDDLDENASGKGEDDEDSVTKDMIDMKEGSGSQPTGSGPDSDDDDDDPDTDLELGSGDSDIMPSSTERPTKRPDISKTSVTTPQESKELEPKKEDPMTEPPDNRVPDHRHNVESSTRFPSTRYPFHNYDDHNQENNDVSSTFMGTRSQVTPVSFFARPGILAAVIGGAVVGLLCAILLVMFIVYRMRKKDEGSYALDEHKRSTAANPYTRGASKELYA